MKKNKRPLNISWQRLSLIILCSVLALILFALIFATSYIHHLLSYVTHNDDSVIMGTLSSEDMATATEETHEQEEPGEFTGPVLDHEDITIETLPSLPPEQIIVDGVFNIMLIGEDRRPGEKRQRSDSMILCSFNTNKNTLSMISFLRDTYVAIPGHSPAKMNAAYQYGGVSLLDQTMAMNFGVHVDANIVINFDGFIKIIDMLGGVDITLTQKESEYMKQVHNYDLPAGLQHLDGEQALMYSRIRKIDWDINRTQRQRNVLTALINSFRGKDVLTMTSIASAIVKSGYIETDMSTQELLGYVRTLFPMLANVKINNQHIPTTDTYEGVRIDGLGDCKVPDLEANRKILKKLLGA